MVLALVRLAVCMVDLALMSYCSEQNNVKDGHLQVEAAGVIADEGDAFRRIDGPRAEMTSLDTHLE